MKISSERLKLSHCSGNDKSHLAMTMLSTVEQLQYGEHGFHVWFGEKSAFTQKMERKQASDKGNTWWVGDFISFLFLRAKNDKYIVHNNRLMQTYLSKINCSCLIVTVYCNSQYVFCYISFINYFLCQRGRLLLALKMLRYGPEEKEFP